MENNEAYFLNVTYYYDIVHEKSQSVDKVVAKGEEALLKSVARNFGLIDGARCSIPPVTKLWLIDVYSDVDDKPVDGFGKFLKPGDESHYSSA